MSLNDARELDLQATWQFQIVGGRHEVGDATLAGLRVHADNGLVGTSHVVRVDRQVGQLPHHCIFVTASFSNFLLAGEEALLNRILVRSGERSVDEVTHIRRTR